MEKIEIKKNTIIFEAGHKADAVYLISKGEIGIFLPQNESLKPNFLSLLIYSKISRAMFWVSLSNILAMFYNILILSAYTNNILDFITYT